MNETRIPLWSVFGSHLCEQLAFPPIFPPSLPKRRSIARGVAAGDERQIHD